jgi:hypothetical protein
MLTNVRADLITVSARHVDIGQYDARPDFFKTLDGCISVVHFDDLEIPIGKDLCDETPDSRAVVSY